jgi:putative Holliday junction resolvase
MEKRIIAFDIGNKRIGVAVSDPFNEYAMPCETYFRTKNPEADASALVKIAQDKGVGTIVCGMPVTIDGNAGEQALKTQTFVEILKTKTDIPIVFEDERFTTKQARDTQLEVGVKLEERKKTIDSIAASYILDGYLARRKKEKEKNTMTEEELLQDEEERIIELEDDQGNLEKFLHIATIEYKGATYCFFQKAEPETEEEEDEVVMFRLDEENELLLPLEDVQLMDEVFAEFCHQYEDFENADEAMQLES